MSLLYVSPLLQQLKQKLDDEQENTIGCNSDGM
jgi:hypothetical protein